MEHMNDNMTSSSREGETTCTLYFKHEEEGEVRDLVGFVSLSFF